MCNRVVQKNIEVKPGGKTTVLLRGPGGEFELEFTEAIFGGPARVESRNYWIRREGAEEVVSCEPSPGTFASSASPLRPPR